jgi:hypothetical protein
MFFSLLGPVVAAIVNALLGRFFPAHPQITPEVVAQAQKDRADLLQNQITARKEADAIRQTISEPVGPTRLNSGVAPSGDSTGRVPGANPADPYERR